MIRLDPLGGNSLNVRELLVASGFKKIENRNKADLVEDPDDKVQENDGEESLPRGISSVVDKHSKPGAGRRSTHHAQDDYDFEDEFIDDTDLMEPSEDFESAEADVDSGKVGKREFNSGSARDSKNWALNYSGNKHIADSNARWKGIVGREHAYEGFYISRGDIPLRPIKDKAKNSAPTKGSIDTLPVGDRLNGVGSCDAKDKLVGPEKLRKETRIISDSPETKQAGEGPTEKQMLQRIPDGAKQTEASKSEPGLKSGIAEDADRVPNLQDVAGGLSREPGIVENSVEKSIPASGSNKKRRASDNPTQTSSRIPEAVLKLLSDMRTLCLRLFAEKKPKVNECGELQEILHRLLSEARSSGIARLQSEKRIIVVQDDLWSRLSFLRTTRQNLETLGHALYWDEEERNAKEHVVVAEQKLRNALNSAQHNSQSVIWTAEVCEALYVWWKSRCALLNASNQLRDSNRQKSIRKVQSGWIAPLMKCCFADLNVTEDNIISNIRRIEDEKIQESRLRKEEERRERIAEREERKAKKLRIVEPKQQTPELVLSSKDKKLKTGPSAELLKLASVKQTLANAKGPSTALKQKNDARREALKSENKDDTSAMSEMDPPMKSSTISAPEVRASKVVLASRALASAAKPDGKAAAAPRPSTKPVFGRPSDKIGPVLQTDPSSVFASRSDSEGLQDISRREDRSDAHSNFEVIELD